MNTMPQVEHMAFTIAETSKYRRHFFFDTGRRRIKHGRIHVALQRDLVAHATARVGDIGRPVESERVTAGFRYRFQPLAAAFGEQRYRHTTAFVFAQQSIDDFSENCW